jgi:hypothetical protein
MLAYQEVQTLAEQLPASEQLRLIQHLSHLVGQHLELEAYKTMPWHEFIERTAGSLSDSPIERPPQPPYETREPLE